MPTYLKEVVRPGTYSIGDRRVSITPDRVQRWARKFHEMKATGLRVPVPWEHPATYDESGKPKEDRLARRIRNKMNAGWVEDMFVTPSGSLYAAIDIPLDSDAARVGTTVHAVSPEFGGVWRDGSGNVWKDAITHVALTPNPVQVQQDGFVRMSRNARDVDPPIEVRGRYTRRKAARALATAGVISEYGDTDQMGLLDMAKGAAGKLWENTKWFAKGASRRPRAMMRKARMDRNKAPKTNMHKIVRAIKNHRSARTEEFLNAARSDGAAGRRGLALDESRKRASAIRQKYGSSGSPSAATKRRQADFRNDNHSGGTPIKVVSKSQKDPDTGKAKVLNSISLKTAAKIKARGGSTIKPGEVGYRDAKTKKRMMQELAARGHFGKFDGMKDGKRRAKLRELSDRFGKKAKAAPAPASSGEKDYKVRGGGGGSGTYGVSSPTPLSKKRSAYDLAGPGVKGKVEPKVSPPSPAPSAKVGKAGQYKDMTAEQIRAARPKDNIRNRPGSAYETAKDADGQTLVRKASPGISGKRKTAKSPWNIVGKGSAAKRGMSTADRLAIARGGKPTAKKAIAGADYSSRTASLSRGYGY